MNGKKKAGLITAGAVAALLAASPLAFATDDAEHGPGPADKACQFVGGSASAESLISGDSGGNGVSQNPVGGTNALNAGNCSDFLNGNGNGNLSGNDIYVAPPPQIPVQDVPIPKP